MESIEASIQSTGVDGIDIEEWKSMISTGITNEDSGEGLVRDKKVGVMSPSYVGELRGLMSQDKNWFERNPRSDGSVARRGGYSCYLNTRNVGNLEEREREMKGNVSSGCGSSTQWENLYSQMDGWKQMVVPESYVHPAKMAPLLCQKIFEHLEELKMIDPDSLVCDFMAGTGTTNIIASLRGYQSVSIELERKFVGIEAANRERLRQYIGKEPRWRIMQGDSRRLSRMLNGGIGVMSPSYGGSEQVDKRWNHPNPGAKNDLVDNDQKSGFQNPKNVGHLKTAIISPPYRNRFDQGNEEQRKRGGTLQSEMNLGGYSSNPSNVGNLKAGVISPPYQDAISSSKADAEGELRRAGYDPKKYLGGKGRQLTMKNDGGLKYGTAKGQIGSADPETYESAMLQIYREAHRAGISPLVTVTKNPTRQGKLVRLDLITIDLLRKAGYFIFDYHQAILFKSHDVSSVNLDGIVDHKMHHKGRIGFFKKLSLNKGSVAASWEDVLFSR